MIEDILRVGTSAGGARAKAILDWNPTTNEFRSGQVKPEPGFEHWLMKFDGVSNNRDKELADPQGYGKIEFAYYLMAKQLGINMEICRLHHEGGRSHFMTRRFDRTPDGDKVHMQSLGAMAHFDYNQPASYSYEQAILVIKQLGLPREDIEQQVLRAMFNIIARNQDDHVKNIAFLMDRKGQWRLSPAYDVTYAWDPKGDWTSRHQMSLNNKRDKFTNKDLVAFAMFAGIKKTPAKKMVEQILDVISNWPQFAKDAGVDKHHRSKIKNAFRLNL
ncbi:type II toxin-antitoxin system HipA family toxin ? [Desulfonema ishimotonii]|uniref:Type II toxin-antitoxin system HipA family toxin n=1 Tax=Desulfonema ishimotonii TaxID=45657 RepID=A0A401G4J3_9BACT|nr:HipA domain-containing protein [Desulfonema ishimotonii]GBC64168.1 type II toxin-antitoxin system HipA family toxin ? [Desulfonema ishimotonii]